MADTLLRFVQTFNSMPADLQKNEVAIINTQPRTEFSRMQLAMIAGLPGSRFRDTARARLLLDEHLKARDSKDEGLRSLATILKSQLNELPKFEDTISSLTQKLKDEQKKSEALQHKLDDLIEVEKTMTERKRTQPK